MSDEKASGRVRRAQRSRLMPTGHGFLEGGSVMPKSILASLLAFGVVAGAATLVTPAHAQTKVVRVWHTETEPQTVKAFNDIARRFEAKNQGIKIEAEGLAWGDLEGKIMAGLA